MSIGPLNLFGWGVRFANCGRAPLKKSISGDLPRQRPRDGMMLAWKRALTANDRSRRKLRAQNVAFEDLIIPDEIHDLLRWNDWVRAYRATAEFFDRRLAASGERQ